MPDGTEDDLVTILTVKGVTKAEKAECLEEFRQSEWSVCSSHNWFRFCFSLFGFKSPETEHCVAMEDTSCMPVTAGIMLSWILMELRLQQHKGRLV